ncbi:MAG: hypothetical protein ABI867_29020 [Kofleriaceae bacterium]
MRAVSSVLVLILLATTTHAQGTYDDAREAVVQFDRGRQLFADGKYALACAAFAHSHQLDPQFGTLYNLAGCYLKRDQLVSALAAYRDLAAHDRNPKRRADAAKHVAELVAHIPKLHLSAPTGWKVTLNGVDVSGGLDIDRDVDPGVYEIVGSIGGVSAFRTTVTAAADGRTQAIAIRGGRASLDVADPFDAHATDAMPRPVVTARPAPVAVAAARDRRYSLFAIGGGAAIAGTGLLFGVLARGKWHDAKAICGGDLGCASQADVDRADLLGDQARSRARVATGMFIVGAALGGAGGYYLWKLSKGARVIPEVDTRGAAVSLAGSF